MSDLPKIDLDTESRLKDWPEDETCTPFEHMCYWLTWTLLVATMLSTVAVVAGLAGFLMEHFAP